MDPIISKMNREILEFIEHMDADPYAERPTTSGSIPTRKRRSTVLRIICRS